MPLEFTEEFNLDNTPKIRTFKGCITNPITLTGDGPITLSVTNTNSTGSISGIRKILDTDVSSALKGKVITNVSFSVDIQRPEIMEFFRNNNNSNYNISYRLSDGTELGLSDVRFEPVPEQIPFEMSSSTGTGIREVSGTASWLDPDPFWRVLIPETKPKVKKSKPKKNKTLIPLSQQLKRLGKK